MAAINTPVLILGIIVLCAIITSALRGPQPKITGKIDEPGYKNRENC